jgi:hypothetical protein
MAKPRNVFGTTVPKCPAKGDRLRPVLSLRRNIGNFLRESLADRLTHHPFDFNPELRSERFGVFKNHLTYGFPKSPFKNQVNPLKDAVYELIFEDDGIDNWLR